LEYQSKRGVLFKNLLGIPANLETFRFIAVARRTALSQPVLMDALVCHPAAFIR
jgi:hypothetical protein